MGIVILILIIFFLLFFYKRYMPVSGISQLDLNYVSSFKNGVVLVDTRDYQVSCRESIEQAYCIPLPYLNRYFSDLPDKDVVIVAADHVEKNLSTRILRGKGVRVIGYCLAKD